MSCLHELGFRSRDDLPVTVRLIEPLGTWVAWLASARVLSVDGLRVLAESSSERDSTIAALEAMRERLPREFSRIRRNADRVVLLGALGQLTPMHRELRLHEGPRPAGRIALELAHANARLWLFDTGRISVHAARHRRLYAALGQRALFHCFEGLQGHPVLEGVTREDAKALAGQLTRALN